MPRLASLHLHLGRPLLFLPGIAAAAVAGIAALVMMPAPQAVAAIVTPTAAPALALVQPTSGRDRNCESCGLVTTIRRTDAATGLDAYEFIVRMSDGSARHSTDATRGRWLEGDRVILIGGTAARALEEEKSAAP